MISFLVTHQNDNHSPGPGRLVPSSHQRSELSNTILGTFQKIRESGSAFQFLMVWGGVGGGGRGATLIANTQVFALQYRIWSK